MSFNKEEKDLFETAKDSHHDNIDNNNKATNQPDHFQENTDSLEKQTCRTLRFDNSNEETDPSEESEESFQSEHSDTSSPGDPYDTSNTKPVRLSVAAPPTECENYLPYQDFSEVFVTKIINNANTTFMKTRHTSFDDDPHHFRVEDENSPVSSSICEMEWPSISDFNENLGAQKIDEFLSFWYLDDDWLYCINFLKAESDRCSDFYEYEAIFSIPLKQYPIAQTTASIYFTIEVSRVIPCHCLVDVTYRFEGNRLIHTPGKYQLQESWLYYIVDAKLKLFKSLTF